MIIPITLITFLGFSLCQSDVPEFIIDFNVHPSERYNEVFEYFKEPLYEMEELFIYSLAPQYRQFFKDNLG